MTSLEIALESELADAALMARVTVEFIGQVLDFDKREPPEITKEGCEQLSFVVLKTCSMIDKALHTFYAMREVAPEK